jgi:hypothetical protein
MRRRPNELKKPTSPAAITQRATSGRGQLRCFSRVLALWTSHTRFWVLTFGPREDAKQSPRCCRAHMQTAPCVPTRPSVEGAEDSRAPGRRSDQATVQVAACGLSMQRIGASPHRGAPLAREPSTRLPLLGSAQLDVGISSCARPSPIFGRRVTLTSPLTSSTPAPIDCGALRLGTPARFDAAHLRQLGADKRLQPRFQSRWQQAILHQSQALYFLFLSGGSPSPPLAAAGRNTRSTTL